MSRVECVEPKGQIPLATSALSRTAKKAPETVSKGVSAEETLRTALAAAEDMKAEDTISINLAGKTSIADYMVVTSGRSDRHVVSVAERVVKDLEKAGVKRIRVEGLKQGDWVLIDAGDVIVHVFKPDVREFYSLEKMWSSSAKDARRTS